MERRSWQYDQAWCRRFLPDLKRILADHLIVEAHPIDDRHYATDLMLLCGAGYSRTACRVRRFEYFEQYPTQFTLRASRPNGVPTELDKILAGWGDYLLYAFADRTGDRLAHYTLLNLWGFRLWYPHFEAQHGYPPGILRANQDGSSQFRVFDYVMMPTSFVIASGPVAHP